MLRVDTEVGNVFIAALSYFAYVRNEIENSGDEAIARTQYKTSVETIFVKFIQESQRLNIGKKERDTIEALAQNCLPTLDMSNVPF